MGLSQAHPLTKIPAMRKQPSDGLGPVTVHPTHSRVGPRCSCFCLVLIYVAYDGDVAAAKFPSNRECLALRIA